MAQNSSCLLQNLSIILILVFLQTSEADPRTENVVKTEVFLSPEIVLEPGLASDKYYFDIDFPRGHIALKSFNAELVDETGNPVPLHETYLHHWVLQRYYARKNVGVRKHHVDHGFHGSDYTIIENSGLCDTVLTQYFGLGAETRRTATYVPDPYGIEVGDPDGIPAGYEEGWLLNVHAIDTRGAEDRMGCTECRCDLYNVTVDQYGQVLPSDYNGGIRCCHDGTRCRVKEGFQGDKRSLYLRYTVKYVDWDPSSIVPVKIYILDVTDDWTKADESRRVRDRHDCVVEYEVGSCPVGLDNNGCIDSKILTVSLPIGGEVVYGVGHQHAGATGITLYGEGGKVICSSNPTYGKGDEPGNEAGYIVGMSTCYPSPAGPVKISDLETLTLVSNYSSAETHTGVMGLFYLLLADPLPKPNSFPNAIARAQKITKLSNFVWPIVLFGVGLTVVVICVLKGKSGKGEGYEAML